jgi:hypothetical protein
MSLDTEHIRRDNKSITKGDNKPMKQKDDKSESLTPLVPELTNEDIVIGHIFYCIIRGETQEQVEKYIHSVFTGDEAVTDDFVTEEYKKGLSLHLCLSELRRNAKKEIINQ